MTRLTATRRGLLGTVLAAASTGAGPAIAATPVPEAATLIAPGPDEGPAARFALDAARGLTRALVQAAVLRVAVLGGPDGITAANRFATSASAEPGLLLMLPGVAGQALLVGETRARYEPRQWPAVAGSLVPALVAGRGALGEIRSPRVALAAPGSPEAAALLALELLGRNATPVYLPQGMAAEAAVSAGVADAAVLTGRAVAARATALGLTPWFTFDGATGARDPGLAQMPALGELMADPARPDLLAAVRAAGAALRVRGLLVLPALSTADTVALWRGAARRWTEAEPEGSEPGARCVAGDEAAAALATLCPGPEVTLAYREWLFRRLNWQAS